MSFRYSGSTFVGSKTLSELSALAASSSLTVGLNIDPATELPYIIASPSSYWPLTDALHLGAIPMATGLAEPFPLSGMTFDASDAGLVTMRYDDVAAKWKPRREQDLFINNGYLGQTAIPSSTAELLLAGASIWIPPGLLGYDGAQGELHYSLDKMSANGGGTGGGDDGTAQTSTDLNTWAIRMGGTNPASAPTTNPLLAGGAAFAFAAGDESAGGWIRFMRRSATSIRLLGVSSIQQVSRFGNGAAGNPRPAAIAVANLDTASNWLHINATNPTTAGSQTGWVGVNYLKARVR